MLVRVILRWVPQSKASGGLGTGEESEASRISIAGNGMSTVTREKLAHEEKHIIDGCLNSASIGTNAVCIVTPLPSCPTARRPNLI